jgi:mono/diheme cytochrome c family protein
MPPEGTVPQGFEVYTYGNDAEAAGQGLKNPMASEMSPEALLVGQKQYVIYCGICHGDKGAGDGTVAAAMAVKPPTLLSDKIRNYPDGRIYHIITRGQGVMGSYASQIPDPKKRWAVVNYIRSLQKGN